MKRSVFILFVFLLQSNITFSNSGQDMVITLTDTLYGEVQVDLAANKIKLRSNKRYQYLTAAQVKWIKKNDHSYCVAAFGIESKFLIFEVLSKGSKPLLYREGVKFNPYDEETFPPYFVLEDRSAYSLATKKDVLSVLGQNEKKVRNFVKNHNLSFSSKEDLSQIFDFYNQTDR